MKPNKIIPGGTDLHSIPACPKPLSPFGASANVYRFLWDPIGYTGQQFERYGPIAALSYGLAYVDEVGILAISG